MPLTVVYNNPAYPKGEEVALKGLGLLENGGAGKELSEVEEIEFLSLYGVTLKEHSEGYKRPGNADLGEPEEVEVAGDDNLKVTGTPIIKAKQAEELISAPVSFGPAPPVEPVVEEGGDK
jgi:hypothetical protein